MKGSTQTTICTYDNHGDLYSLQEIVVSSAFDKSFSNNIYLNRWRIVVGWFSTREDQYQNNDWKQYKDGEGNVLFVAEMNDELSWYMKTMYASKIVREDEEKVQRNNASS